jgi:hypothetical protein
MSDNNQSINKINLLILVFILFIFEFVQASIANEYIQYIHPKENSKYVSCQTDLIIRFHKKWQKFLNDQFLDIQVTGSLSGHHEGEIVQTKDQVTFLFKPTINFMANEVVHVNVQFSLSGYDKSLVYDFYTSSNDVSRILKNGRDAILPDEATDFKKPAVYGEMTVINGVSVPADFPEINIDTFDTTADGRLFLANDVGGRPYIMILENDGTPYFYQRLSENSRDFKLQPTGTLTRVKRYGTDGFIEIDSNFVNIDTLYCGNDYFTDTHDILLMENGNYLIIAIDNQTINMSEIVEGGQVDARVMGNHIQEIDRDGNVLFEWRSWDYFNIIDAVHEDLTANTIDYVHMNAIAIDYDGHLLISSRHLSEITKIDRESGEIIWRLGGENNQFDFVLNPHEISYQHDIRPVPGKENHYTLFDNGYHRIPSFSRAIEFVIDTTNMTATKIWEYRHNPDRFTYSRGSVQRLANGNSLIDWAGGNLPILSEVAVDNSIVHEISFTDQMRSYRSYRYDWNGIAKQPYLIAEPYPDKVTLIFNKFGDKNVTEYIVYGGLNPNPETVIDTTSNTWINLTQLQNYSDYYFRITALDSMGEESAFSNQEKVFAKFVDQGKNLILNGDFSNDTDYWLLNTHNEAEASSEFINSECHLLIENAGTKIEDIQMTQENITLQNGKWYLIEFDGVATDSRIIELKVERVNPPFDNYSQMGLIMLLNEKQHYSHEFEMEHLSDFNARLVLNIGANTNDVFLDNVSLKEIESSLITNKDDHIPSIFYLSKNYPNPFNSTTIINYKLPMTNYIELNIYNVISQRVATLVSEKQNAGNYQVEWDASGFASGVYYYRLSTSAGFVQTKKLVLLK